MIYCFLGVSALQKHDPIKLKMAANTFSIGEESNITPQVWGQHQARGAGRGAVQETREHLFLCDRGDCYSMLLLPRNTYYHNGERGQNAKSYGERRLYKHFIICLSISKQLGKLLFAIGD